MKALTLSLLFLTQLWSAPQAKASYTEMMRTLIRYHLATPQEVIESSLAYEQMLDRVSGSMNGERFHVNKVNHSLADLALVKTAINEDLYYASSLLLPTFAADLDRAIGGFETAVRKYDYNTAEKNLADARMLLRAVRSNIAREYRK
jgi:hypothetical protein